MRLEAVCLLLSGRKLVWLIHRVTLWGVRHYHATPIKLFIKMLKLVESMQRRDRLPVFYCIVFSVQFFFQFYVDVIDDKAVYRAT